MPIQLTDSFINEVVIGLVTSGLWSLMAQTSNRVMINIKEFVSPPKPELISAVRSAIDEFQKAVDPDPGSKQARLGKQEWDVVAQLAFQIQSKRVQGAADKLLSLLLKENTSSEAERRNTLLFAERSLEFLVPSPKVRREIAQAALSSWLSNVLSEIEVLFPRRNDGEESIQHIANLLNVANENRPTIGEELDAFIRQRIEKGQGNEKVIIAELMMQLAEPRGLSFNILLNHDAETYFRTLGERVCIEHRDRIREVAITNAAVCTLGYFKRMVSLEEAINWFGLEVIFNSAKQYLRNGYFFPIGTWLAVPFLNERMLWVSPAEEEFRYAEIEWLASKLRESATPWLENPSQEHIERMGYLYGFPFRSANEAALEAKRTGAINFLLICILAIDVETDIEIGHSKEVEAKLERISPRFKRAVVGRVSPDGPENALKELETLKLDHAQKEFISRWIKKEICLVDFKSK